ncbi:MAG: DNA starvation/stationary phase protection protein [Myxococcales bacterium]
MEKQPVKKPSARSATRERAQSDFSPEAIEQISVALNTLLADTFGLYVKTKNFHWHLEGPHFRDYHLLLDEQSDQIFAMSDPLAERVRKVGGRTLTSLGQMARLERIADNDQESVLAPDMLRELQQDNRSLAGHLREAHEVCDKHQDFASASLIENWIDEAERRAWFLYEATQRGET